MAGDGNESCCTKQGKSFSGDLTNACSFSTTGMTIGGVPVVDVSFVGAAAPTFSAAFAARGDGGVNCVY